MIREDCLNYFKGWVCTNGSVYVSEYYSCCRKDCHITDCTNCVNYERQDKKLVPKQFDKDVGILVSIKSN